MLNPFWVVGGVLGTMCLVSRYMNKILSPTSSENEVPEIVTGAEKVNQVSDEHSYAFLIRSEILRRENKNLYLLRNRLIKHEHFNSLPLEIREKILYFDCKTVNVFRSLVHSIKSPSLRSKLRQYS
jgi:hypothetical protein